jgi:uncharacterized protein YaaN involved in tellurite resistance
MSENNVSNENKNVTVKDSVDMSKFSSEELAKVESIKKQINLEDSQAVITYGVGAQRDISTFADSILKEIRNKDSGYVGKVLSDLVMKVREVDVDSIGKESNFITRFFANAFNSVKRFILRYEKISVQIEKIVDELDNARMQMLRDITLLDTMYSKNLEYMKNLNLYIAAGQSKLEELQANLLPALKATAEQTQNSEDIQKYNDFTQFLNRFEKKIYDLKLSRVISIQTSPQIRLIQNGDQALVEKIQSSILNTIPLWKNQMVIAITLLRQKKSLELQKEVTKTTNDLLTRNSELLKTSTLEIAKEAERGIVEIDTLKKVNSDLISTIEETLKIQSEGKSKRQQAEMELVKIEGELKAKLLSLKN